MERTTKNREKRKQLCMLITKQEKERRPPPKLNVFFLSQHSQNNTYTHTHTQHSHTANHMNNTKPNWRATTKREREREREYESTTLTSFSSHLSFLSHRMWFEHKREERERENIQQVKVQTKTQTKNNRQYLLRFLVNSPEEKKQVVNFTHNHSVQSASILLLHTFYRLFVPINRYQRQKNTLYDVCATTYSRKKGVFVPKELGGSGQERLRKEEKTARSDRKQHLFAYRTIRWVR